MEAVIVAEVNHRNMSREGVILASDEQARLKPCLRCGYSLRHIAGAKNCPECGLAVRVSLSGNSGLEWSNPRWQRFRALAFGVLALGLACRLLSAAAYWIESRAFEDYYKLHGLALSLFDWVNTYASEADPIICGFAFCLLAKGEGRHPDHSRAVRRIALGIGLSLFAIGSLNALVRHGVWLRRPIWSWYVLRYTLRGPWIPLVISTMACTYALVFGKRGRSRLLLRVAQVPIWPATAGLITWLLNLDQLIRPVPLLLSNIAFPLAAIVLLVVAIRVLLAGAREADLNWVTDP